MKLKSPYRRVPEVHQYVEVGLRKIYHLKWQRKSENSNKCETEESKMGE